MGDYLTSHAEWTESGLIPQADLARITHDPPALRKYKTQREGLGTEFPHHVRTVDALTCTPFGNDLVIDFAERVIEAEKVGTEDGTPDIVYVGLSSPDYLGHAYGPDSLEVADTVVRTDRQLARFFAWLDEKFGSRYAVAISSDHGVQSIPEVARDMGRDAGRVDMKNPNATGNQHERDGTTLHIGIPAAANALAFDEKKNRGPRISGRGGMRRPRITGRELRRRSCCRSRPRR